MITGRPFLSWVVAAVLLGGVVLVGWAALIRGDQTERTDTDAVEPASDDADDGAGGETSVTPTFADPMTSGFDASELSTSSSTVGSSSASAPSSSSTTTSESSASNPTVPTSDGTTSSSYISTGTVTRPPTSELPICVDDGDNRTTTTCRPPVVTARPPICVPTDETTTTFCLVTTTLGSLPTETTGSTEAPG